MKKTLFVVALAAMLVFAFATMAMASSFTLPSASLWYYTKAGAPAAAGSGLYNPWSEGTYSGVEVTSAALVNLEANGGAESPHGDYTTTTIKCATCHSTHGAAPGAEVLLRAGGDLRGADGYPNACVFCHVDTDTGIGLEGTMVYSGSGMEVVGGPTGDGYHSPEVNCDRCHATVHGMGVLDKTTYPALSAKLLKNAGSSYTSTQAIAQATAAVNGFDAADTSSILTNADSKYWALIGAWCSACHAGSFNGQSNAAANLNSTSFTMTGHRLNAVDTDSWTAAAGYEAFSGVKVAWKGVDGNCQNCHDAVNDQGHPGFPHYASGAAAFLGMAADSDAAVVGIGVGKADSENPTVTEEATLQDGICLKCHKSGAGAGVGGTF